MPLPRIVATGIYNAQIAFKNRTVSPNRKTTMFEIELPMEEGGTSYVNQESHPITQNLLICAKPGQIRHTRLPFKCYYLHMIVNEGPLYEALTSLPNYLEIGDTAPILELFREIQALPISGTPDDELLLLSRVFELVSLLKRNAVAAAVSYQPKSNNREVIQHVLEYIRQNLGANLTLDALAAEAKFSPVYFHKLFKRSTGLTLREYIEEQRLKRSVELLISTDMSLSQIAYECGFSSQSYFSYAFKKKTGSTPREYAKALLKTYES